MSEADLDVIRDHYAATNERDFDRAMSHYAENVVLEVTDQQYLTQGTYRGREPVGAFFGDWFRSFDSDLHFEITRLEELEDGSVLLVADNDARGRASGIELKGTVIWVYRLRNGKIVHVESAESPDAAVQAAAERAKKG